MKPDDGDTSTTAIASVLHAALACLGDAFGALSNAERPVGGCDLHAIASRSISTVKPQIPAHSALLDTAISAIDNGQLGGVKLALCDAKDHLHWKIDDGGYYANGADVGTGYKNGNMHTLLVGPENAVVTSNDFLLGFYLLAPWTLYRDHKHLAPEIYIPLTGPSGWRFGLGEWRDHGAGSKIYNPPQVVHATRTYATPFLALFAWTRDIASVCQVVDAPDWTDIERELSKHSARNF